MLTLIILVIEHLVLQLNDHYINQFYIFRYISVDLQVVYQTVDVLGVVRLCGGGGGSQHGGGGVL